ncbi:DUF2017 family protein [Microbacterium sp.]|uniref:DUF2017 family protein n=1 Tax=Microbacterium sp. TaxID=51671 RepID=UPI0039E579FA
MSIVRVEMAPVEQMQLRRIVIDFVDLLTADDGAADPALARLTPNPYPDDVDAARDFRETTRRDLIDQRLTDARIVIAALTAAADGFDELSDDDAFLPRAFDVPDADLDAWLRTLTAVRLVVAVRLGIDDEDRRDADDPRYAAYDWLGYRLEVLIEAADELEA